MKPPGFQAEWARELVFSWVRQIVAATPGSTIAEQQRKAAKAVGLPVSRFRDLWSREARRVDVHEAWAVQHRRNELAEQDAGAQNHNALRRELVEKAPRLVAFLAPPPLPTQRKAK